VAAYRGGYLAEERRELEQQLADGTLRGIAATNALELGVDIGGLDAVVINGFPGTIASFWQQAGRTGRQGDGGRTALAALVAGDDQLDRWYFTHPDELFHRPPEAAVVNPANPYVLRPQLACAAFEQPLAPSDERWFGDGLHDAVRDLVHADLLKPRDGRVYWAAREPPAPSVSLRSGSPVEYQLVGPDGRAIGSVDGSRVYSVAHPGAIYVHQGRQYRVAELDLDGHRAVVEETDADEWTQTRHDTDVEILSCTRAQMVGRLAVHVGSVAVSSQVTAYQRRALGTGEVIEVVGLDLPRQHLETTACWFEVPHGCFDVAGVAPNRVGGAVHAVEHAFIGMLPRAAICDRWDVGGVSMAIHPQVGEPTIFVYDGYQGGAGLAELAFAVAESTLAAVAELVGACPCEEGCPSCVQSPKCGNWNEYLDKAAAMALLRATLR
jgi:DEAD/DEAH box helicase domain-containing protein